MGSVLFAIGAALVWALLLRLSRGSEPYEEHKWSLVLKHWRGGPL